jgi:hypothetical protein
MSRLLKRRNRLNSVSYQPLVYKNRQKVQFTPESLREYKLQQIQRIDKRLGVRNPKRRLIRNISGLELQEAIKDMDLPPNSPSGTIGISAGAMGSTGNMFSPDIALTGGVTLLYIRGKNKATVAKAESVSGKPKEGLSGLKYKRRPSRDLLTSYMDTY